MSFRTFWTQEKIALLDGYAKQGMSAGLIAERLGCTRSAVLGRCDRHRVKLTGGETLYWPGDAVEQLKQLWQAGESPYAIASKMKRTRTAISKKANELGLTEKPSAPVVVPDAPINPHITIGLHGVSLPRLRCLEASYAGA